MTREPTETLAPGASANDLVSELDALLPSIQRRDISLDEFTAELRRIGALAAARVGERPAATSAPRLPTDDESTPEEDAYDLWCSVRATAVNRYVPWEDVERELEAELGPGEPNLVLGGDRR